MGEENIYDLATGDEPAKPGTPKKPADSAPPLARPAAPQRPDAAEVLNYHRATADRAARVAWDDPWEGNKAKNLVLPLALIAVSMILNFLYQAYFMQQKGTAGAAAASREMSLSLGVQVPSMLLACWVAVHWLDASFGPLWPALVKLSAIALAPDALWGLAMMIGAVAGHSGGAGGSFVGAAVGWVIGWAVGLALYFSLFVYFLRLEMGDALKVTFLVWIARVFVAQTALAIVQNYFS
jgi:hypothetical protein